MANSRIRNQIRRWRFERNEMTQQSLADRVGVTRYCWLFASPRRWGRRLSRFFNMAERLRWYSFQIAVNQ
jgi:putative transcriptional regulator